MDAKEAQQHLHTADAAYRASALPPMPWRIAAPAAVMIGAAVAVSGQYSDNGVIRLSFWIGAVALAAAAVGLVQWARHRRGLAGLRGPAREAMTAQLTSALAVLVIAIVAPSGMGWYFLGSGVVLAVLAAAALRNPQYLLPRKR
ncbi:hypothetical protein [Nocardia terpenica]|uniref:Uncharacterized protein n=1 Tax=Nocardia terpenica TaxID=455432 RepID=A0A6G9ZDY2_9NOCA|nr:hypothetical protein [Nocardia terpenica]QIS23722.1 hypothetical protein F6W96_41020 [Nocardia terpenica]